MITTGDLVVVVGSPCTCLGAHKHIGKVFRVAQLVQDSGTCTGCWKYHHQTALAANALGEWYPVFTLKRIPPLPESETQQNEEELTV